MRFFDKAVPSFDPEGQLVTPGHREYPALEAMAAVRHQDALHLHLYALETITGIEDGSTRPGVRCNRNDRQQWRRKGMQSILDWIDAGVQREPRDYKDAYDPVQPPKGKIAKWVLNGIRQKRYMTHMFERMMAPLTEVFYGIGDRERRVLRRGADHAHLNHGRSEALCDLIDGRLQVCVRAGQFGGSVKISACNPYEGGVHRVSVKYILPEQKAVKISMDKRGVEARNHWKGKDYWYPVWEIDRKGAVVIRATNPDTIDMDPGYWHPIANDTAAYGAWDTEPHIFGRQTAQDDILARLRLHLPDVMMRTQVYEPG